MRSHRCATLLITVCSLLLIPPICLHHCGGALADAAESLQSPECLTQYVDPASFALDTSESVTAACNAVYYEYRASIAARENELAQGQITLGDLTMRVDTQTIGEPEAHGYPLFIALHGGGSSASPAMNDAQWSQMKDYYKATVTNGVYVTPRGIRDTWDTHFNPESFAFYDRIIEDAIAFAHVDPNRVYLLGFSAGGDGVYAIAPRMADRFAAVNMSAGHPNGISVINLYALPIILQVGALDTAYSRNTVTAEYDALLAQASLDYGGGYVHATFVHIGAAHNFCDNGTDEQPVAADVQAWLANGDETVRLADTNAVRLTAAYTRDANPTRVVWEVAANAPARSVRSFYWLGRDDALDNGVIIAGYDSQANRITVESCTAQTGTLKIYLKPAMVDLFAPVTVDFCGAVTALAVTPTLQVMRDTAWERGDPDMVYAALVEVNVATGEVTAGGQ